MTEFINSYHIYKPRNLVSPKVNGGQHYPRKKLERMCPCISKLATQKCQLCIAAGITLTILGRTGSSQNLQFPAILNTML